MPSDEVLSERVSAIEEDVRRIKEDIGFLRNELGGIILGVQTLKTDVAAIKEDIRHLPTKGWVVGAVITTAMLIGALIALAPRLQKLVGSI